MSKTLRPIYVLLSSLSPAKVSLPCGETLCRWLKPNGDDCLRLTSSITFISTTSPPSLINYYDSKPVHRTGKFGEIEPNHTACYYKYIRGTSDCIMKRLISSALTSWHKKTFCFTSFSYNPASILLQMLCQLMATRLRHNCATILASFLDLPCFSLLSCRCLLLTPDGVLCKAQQLRLRCAK
jgi:hypothetical protein